MLIDDNLNIRCFFDVIVEHALHEDCVDVSLLSKDFAAGDVGDLQELAATRNQYSGQKRKLPGNGGQSDALVFKE